MSKSFSKIAESSELLSAFFASEFSRQLFEKSQFGMLIVDREGNCHAVNQAFLSQLGVPSSAVLKDSWRNLVVSDPLNPIDSLMVEAEITKAAATAKVIWRKENGVSVVSQVSIVGLENGDEIVAFTIEVDDRTEIEWNLTRSRAREEKLNAVLDSMSEGVVVQDLTGRIILHNPAAQDILGLTCAQLSGRDSFHPEWRCIHEDGSPFPGEDHPAMVSLTRGERVDNQVMGVHKPTGTISWISINSVPLLDAEEERPYAAVTTFADITDTRSVSKSLVEKLQLLHEAHIEIEMRQRELEAVNLRLKEVSETDALTGLKNRRAFTERLESEVSLSDRYGHNFSVLLVDVDFFKQYNDTYGHLAGDEVLETVAKLFLDALRRSDFVARYGGEEFAILLPHTGSTEALQVAERIRQSIERYPWELRPVTASLGICEYITGSGLSKETIESADRALYRAKTSGRNRTIVGESALKLEKSSSNPKRRKNDSAA